MFRLWRYEIALVINHNLMAMNAARNLTSSFMSLSASIRRLSSGLRVGAASDDPAGLAVRELMRADVASLNQGMRNANDAISLIQTADGALQVIDEKLIRMKELAEQAATGTYNSDQRLIIDSEYQAMASEISRIASATDFNGIHLLNGNLYDEHNGSGIEPYGALKVHFGSGNDCAEDYYYIRIGNATAEHLFGVEVAHKLSELIDRHEAALDAAVAAVGGGVAGQAVRNAITNAYTDNVSGWTPDTREEFAEAYQRALDAATGLLGIPALAAGGQSYLDYEVYMQGTGSIGVGTQAEAQTSLKTLDRAIISKDKIRANLGSLQNRLENTVGNLSIQMENLQAAESRISDADLAKEMTAFVRSRILSDSATAMLVQANSLPRMALTLLAG